MKRPSVRPAPAAPAPGLGGRVALFAPLLALAWWVVAEGRPGSWSVGLPVVVAAAVVAAAVLRPPARAPSPAALARFAGFFFVQSVRGGVDVARRAFAPGLPLAPAFVTLRTKLRSDRARVLLADVVSLLPGTVSLELERDELLVHGLDAAAVEPGVRGLERRIAALAGEDAR